MEGLDHDYGLTLRSGTGDAAPAGAWAELARSAGQEDDKNVDPAELVRLVNSSPHAFLIGHRIYGALKSSAESRLTDQIAAAAEHDRASRLIVGLKPDVLASALASQANLGDRRNVLNAAADVISPAAVHSLAIAAAASYQQPASEVLDLLLRKLETEATQFSGSARVQADQAFRSLVHELIYTWSSASVDTTATGFEHLFQEVEKERPKSSVPLEPERIVYLALETGAVGSVLWSAVAELTADDNPRHLLGMLKSAPEGSRAALMIAQQFANPQRLTLLLREEPVDFDAIDALLRHMQLAAGETLLDELIQSNSRVTRRGIIERLARLGPGLEPMILERMKDERWFVLRNMLHVMNESGSPTTRVPVSNYQNHSDPRVRREAMLLLFKDSVARDRALANAFKETDPAMLRVALREARNGLPDVGVPVLAKRILESDFPPEFRVPSIQLLGRSRSLLALDPLLKFVAGGTTLMGKPKLAANTPEMIAALKGLARTWANERRAKILLELAAASSDPQVAAAADGGKVEPIRELDEDGL
jgi:hypothetical protein